MRKKKGQNTLEYIIILVAVISAVLIFVAFLKPSNTDTGVKKLMRNSGERIGNAGINVTEWIPVAQ